MQRPASSSLQKAESPLRRFSVPLLILLANSSGGSGTLDFPFTRPSILPKLQAIGCRWEFANSISCWRENGTISAPIGLSRSFHGDLPARWPRMQVLRRFWGPIGGRVGWRNLADGDLM